MLCPDCGTKIPKDARHCPKCDTVVSESVAEGMTPDSPTETLGVSELRDRLQDALGSQYAVERSIGQGGFAVVFLVRDLTLKRPLAVKVISPDLIISHAVLERFRREAETIAQLSHPNIVPVHFVGSKGDLFYLAMTFVDGESLADRVSREGSLSVEESARILREIASALDLAHRRGVVHRDVKPHNVLLEKETRRALLTDFGIARTAEGEHLTATGMVVGTPAYMSPEQVTGDKVDHRADIYALGIVGYEMLAGQLPFTGENQQAVLMQRVMGDPTPIDQIKPEVPQWLASVVSKCLATDPALRVGDAGEIARALETATPVEGSQVMPVAKFAPKRIRNWIVAAAVVVLGMAGAVWISRGGGAVAEPAVEPVVMIPAAPPAMVIVPGGTFIIGRANGGFTAPAHEVTLDSFAIDRTEVSIASYQEFIAETSAPIPWSALPDSTLPVTRVNWFEARDYCRWRYQEGRLPTEEEWEAAARGPEGTTYPWSETTPAEPGNTGARGLGALVPVGSSQNALGAFDLIGNVWEWTSSPARVYPGGQDAPARSDGAYVIRGGAFDSAERFASPSYRGYLPPTDNRSSYEKTGFRCALSLLGTASNR